MDAVCQSMSECSAQGPAVIIANVSRNHNSGGSEIMRILFFHRESSSLFRFHTQGLHLGRAPLSAQKAGLFEKRTGRCIGGGVCRVSRLWVHAGPWPAVCLRSTPLGQPDTSL